MSINISSLLMSVSFVVDFLNFLPTILTLKKKNRADLEKIMQNPEQRYFPKKKLDIEIVRKNKRSKIVKIVLKKSVSRCQERMDSNNIIINSL